MIIEYLLQYIFRNNLLQLEFIKQGLGIAQRKRRFSEEWKSHLDCSKRIQDEWCKELYRGGDRGQESAPTWLIVLGAGRCFDLHEPILSQGFSRIIFVDADPFSGKTWRKLTSKVSGSTRISGHCQDITGFLGQWASILTSKLETIEGKDKATRWRAALNHLENITLHRCEMKTSRLPSIPADVHFAILSLNMLSQLPVIWQNFVEAKLQRHFSKKWVKENEEEWLQAFFQSGEFLIEKHLIDLGQTSATEMLLITDLEYAIYRENVPLLANGQFVESTGQEIYSSLFGIDLENPQLRKKVFPNHSSQHLGNWLWHIAPKGIEEEHQGSVHRVGAFTFKKHCSAIQNY